MSKTDAMIECGSAMYELSGNDIDAVGGGSLLGIAGLSIEGVSTLDVASHWVNGMLAEQVSQYRSVVWGGISIGI